MNSTSVFDNILPRQTLHPSQDPFQYFFFLSRDLKLSVGLHVQRMSPAIKAYLSWQIVKSDWIESYYTKKKKENILLISNLTALFSNGVIFLVEVLFLRLATTPWGIWFRVFLFQACFRVQLKAGVPCLGPLLHCSMHSLLSLVSLFFNNRTRNVFYLTLLGFLAFRCLSTQGYLFFVFPFLGLFILIPVGSNM